MKKNFADVEVKVVDCPDLSQKPFMLASKGDIIAQSHRFIEI